MDTRQTFLAQIDAFLAQSGMSESYFGKRACGNSELVQRLRAGGGATIQTMDRVTAYIAENTPEAVK